MLVAALASVATTPASWHFKAKAPPPAQAPEQGHLVTVEVSHRPGASLSFGGYSTRPSRAEQDPSWPKNRYTFFVPPGAELTDLHTAGYCQGCSACAPVPGAFVNVIGVEGVKTWQKEVTGAPVTTRIKKYKVSDVGIEGPPGVSHLELIFPEGRPEGVSMKVNGFWSDGDTQGIRVEWSGEADAAVKWAPRVVVDGYCLGDAPCAPPAKQVSIRYVNAENG